MAKADELISSSAFAEAKLHKLKSLAEKRGSLVAPENPLEWAKMLFPKMITKPFAQRHIEMLEWAWAIEPGIRPRPFVSIQPRGGGKSTNSELATIMVGARNKRKYAWYVSETQALADAHLESIAGLIESPIVEAYYPSFAKPHIGKYGSSKVWRRNRLRTSSGFTVDALGLDTAKRGTKLVESRPDFMIFDDIDARHDSGAITTKKIDTITTSLLPAGSSDTAILFVQNLIIDDGVFGRLMLPTPPFLQNRILSGPYPALEHFVWWYNEQNKIVVDGTPTWEGQDLQTCQQQVEEWGLSAFRREAQHEMIYEGGLFSHLKFIRRKRDELPVLWRIVVAVDPAVTSSDNSDAHGIQVAALGEDGKVYMLESWEKIASPEISLKKALYFAIKHKATTVLIEGNQGGDLWLDLWEDIVSETNIDEDLLPYVELVKASSGTGGKMERASQLCAEYERGMIEHLENETARTLEAALYRFPMAKPYDLVDSAWWAWNELRSGSDWLIA